MKLSFIHCNCGADISVKAAQDEMVRLPSSLCMPFSVREVRVSLWTVMRPVMLLQLPRASASDWVVIV